MGKIEKLQPSHTIPGLDATVGDFWAWAFSDILSNATRGVFAEFIVGIALDVLDTPRDEWDIADLKYKGYLIEVKSSGYIQSWKRDELSKIKLDIAKKSSGDNSNHTGRAAHCYVFCIFKEKDRTKANVLDIDQWDFYVAHTEKINQIFGDQKSMGISTLQKHFSPVKFSELKETIDKELKLGK